MPYFPFEWDQHHKGAVLGGTAMKWLALFWVYRREFWKGWKRGRRPTVSVFPPEVLIPAGAIQVELPVWIDRPLDAPEFSDEAVKRLYGH